MGLLDKVNNLVETIKNAVSGGSSSNESSAHSSGGGTSSNAARSAAQAAAAKYQADGQKRTTSTKSYTNNVLVDSVKHTPASSGRTYSGTGAKAQNPEKAEKKAAAQTAADIAQQRGQSRTNYLKTYKTEESNYQAPKYKSSEDLNGARANTYDPADRYIAQAEGARNSTVDYMTGAERKAAEKASKRPKNYLSEADFKQMDINDSYSPNWMNDKTWQQRETEGKDFSIPKWFQNVAGSVLNSVGGSFSSNAGIAYEAGNEGRIQQGTEAMNDAWRTYVQALYAQATSDNPSEFNANVESAMRNLKGFADAIGPGVFEQTVANAENAMAEYRKDPNNFDIEYWLNNGNSGTLPDLTTFEGASIATRDLAQSMFAQSQAQNEAAKAALGNTTAGNILTDVAINLAEQGIDAAVGFLGSMGAAPQIASKVYQSISLGNMALRVFGQTASQVRDEGGNFGQQTFEAGLAAGVEVLTEKMSGGIAKFYGKGDTDEIVEEIARRVTQSDFGRSVIRTIGGMTGEAFEEVISTVVDPVVRAVHDSEATDKYATAEGRQELATEAGYSALVAALAALAGSSATYINGSNAQANAALTQTDQIQAELESNGMSTKDARKVAPNVQKYQSEGFEGLSKSEQKTLTNPLIRSIYGIDIELDSATDTINKQTDGKRVKPAQVAAAEKTMSDRLTPEIFAEYKKFNDESQTRETVMAAADAFNNELFDAVEGDVILDQNNRPVGRVKTVNDYGITIQYNDGTTESAVFMGNNGLLDPNSNLAKVFNDGGGVVAQDDADIIIRNAEQERKAQIKAGEEMQDRGEKAQPQTQAAPKADTSAPHKAPTPAKAQPTQQQTTQEQTPQQEQQASQTPQFQNQDVYDNNKYEVKETDDGYEVYNENGESVGTYGTYAEAVELVSQLSQNDTTQESPQNASQSVSQEEGNSVLPNEQNTSEVQNEELNSKPEAAPPDTAQKAGENLRNTDIGTWYYKESDRDANFMYTLKNGYRIVVDYNQSSAGTWGIYDQSGNLVGDYSKKSIGMGAAKTEKFFADIMQRVIDAAGTVDESDLEVAKTDIVYGGPWSSRKQSDYHLNRGYDATGKKIETDVGLKPKAETGIRYKQDLNGYTIQASKENPTLDMRIDNSPAPNTTAVGGTVSAETVQDALIGKTVSEGAANHEGTLSEKQVAKLSPVQVIQRLQNYAKKARTSIKGLLKHITSDESGEALIGREAYTKQLIESSVGETRGMNAQGEYEDEVDVVGGEDDTRKERPKRSAEEAQEEVNEINRSNLMTLGDTIRDAMKAANIGRYRSGIDGICDWILDKGRQRRGDAPTQAEYEAFRDLVKKMLNDEYHRQNNYKKDKKGNLIDINWKRFNTAKVLDLIDTALAGEADVDALNDADFTEINALLERAAKIRVGYGETKNSRLGDVYSGYMDLRSILEGDEAFQEDLNSEIYDGTNLTAGEKWITDEDGNEVKVSDEEGWRENPKEQEYSSWSDRSDAREGMTEAERQEYEESYWAQNGERDVANMWQQKSEQTGKGNSVVEEYLPSTSPRLSRKPGVDLPTSISGVTITQKANELSNAAINLISKKLREMGDLQHAINRNAQDISDIKANPSGNAVVDNAKIKQHERMIETLQKWLAPYEEWSKKIEGQYTINDLLNDSFLTEAEKEAFKAQLDKDVRFGRIDLQTIALNNRIASTTYYLQVGDGMFRQLLDTKTNTQLKAIVEQHEQNIKNLQRRIADNKEYVKSLNPINKALIDKYNKAIEAAENRLAREQEWLKKATGKAGSYTLNDYFADPFIRQYYADEVKGIDTETKENGVAVFGNYQFNGLRNAKSWDFANDLIKDIKKGVLSGELSEHGFNSRGEAGRSLNGERLGLGETTVTEASDYDSADRIRAGEYQAGTQTGGTERTNALLNRGRTQTSGTGAQTDSGAATGNSQSVRTENGRQNDVGVSGQSSDAQSTRNPFSGRDNQTVFKDVSDAWNKSNGNTEDVTRDLISKGYSVTTYRDGKTIVITDKQRPIGTFSNKDGRNTRLNNRLKNNPKFTAYSASKIAVIETDAYGKTTVEMKLGLLAFNRKTGETTLYAANVDSANHELNHDDWTLADNAISDRILGGENIDTIDDMFHNGLVKALDDIGVDYKTLSQYIQSLDYQADEVDEELFAELNAVMYEGSTSDWDGDTSISDIAHRLMQHEGFHNLVKQIRDYADEAERAAQNTQPIRYKQDLDQYSDESFDALVNDTSYEEASAINGQNYDQYDLNSEFNAEQASETETLNSMSGKGVDTTSAPIENFQNAEQASENAAMEDLSGTGVDTERTPIDYFQSQEQASESDLIREQSRNDLTGSEDSNFESPYEAEQRTEQEAMDSLYENMDGRKLTSPKRTANDYYGSAYARVQETQKKHKRNKARSSFSIAELYYKTYGETNDSIRNFKRLQRLNSNVDSLLDGKMSYYDFNSFAKNMSSRQGIGQILNDDIQRELDTVVALEEAAQDKNASEQDVADFQYAAANVVSHIVARMDMVEKTERARARLDTAAKKHGAKGGRKNLVGTALDAWNRYQITGDNFWRMMDDWAGKGQGYSYAREHLKTIATRISEEAKLKGYFALEGVDRKSKEFKDFVDGTSMSNVDFDGHKISLMEGIKFVKTVDTLRMFASENGRPSWQRVAALGGFTFEGKNGKPIFVDIQGSYDNNAAARAAWVEQRYNQLKQEIANNKAASAYMSAVEEMYYEASKDAEKVHSRVNGYDRYMYGKGWYTDIHYAKKGDGSVDFRYSDRDATDVHDTASMQRRTKVAGGYAIINPMSRSVDAYISQISNYIAFEEFGQKLGVLSDSKSINGSYANTIRDAYGDQYAQWFDNYVKTMTLYKENKPKGGMNSALAKARQAMMSGALIGSVLVPIKQVSSFFDTMGTLDPRAVAAVFVQNPLGRKQKGIKNYLMDSRNQSISDPDLAELFGDKGILRKIKDTRIGKLAMSATNMMDATAVSNVYRACVLDVEYNNPLGKGIYNNGKNFKDGLTPDGQFYVDAKFEEALLGSQPIFTPQARNELARTDNQFARMFSTFRTQQTQNYNRMLQTWNEYQAARKNDGNTKEAWKKFVQTMTGQMIASASLSALTAIANTVLHKHKRYKDDDDELDEEKFWKRFGLGAFESLMGNSLFVGDITKWAIDLYNSQNDPNWNWKYSTKESQYFDAIEGMHIPIPASGAIGTAIQALNSAINLYRDVDENGWSDQNKLSARYLAGNIATAFGVQLNNVYYALNAGYQWYMDAAQLVTGDKKYEKKYDDIFTQMVKVDYSQQNRLVNSILAGKTQKVADMFDDMGQDKFENAVYYGAFDQYKAGKIDKAEYIELLMNFAGKSYKEASNEVEKKSRLLESGISQYNGIDGRDGRKAFYDQYSGNFQSRDAYKQFFEDVKNGKAEGKHNTYYTQWYGQPQEVSANQSSIIDTMNRNIQAGNFSYDTAKLLWENYYGYSTSKYSAWKFVGK